MDHVFVTSAGVKVRSRQSDDNRGAITFGDDPPITLPVNGLDVKAADQADGDCWAVVSGQDDYPYLIKRLRSRIPVKLTDDERLKTHGRDAIWVTPDGDVSWLVKGGTLVKHMNGAEEPAEFRHPLTPLGPPHIETWGAFRVTNVYRTATWASGEDVTAPQGRTRTYLRQSQGPVWLGFEGYTSRLTFHAEHSDGSCTLAVSLPGTFIHSSNFTLATVPGPTPEPEPEPEPDMPLPNFLNVAIAVDQKYPHLLQKARTQGEQFRGDYVDQLAHTLNKRPEYVATKPWGRKQKGDGSLNTDALTFLYDASDRDKKHLIDVVMGNNFVPGWDQRPASEEPGNGKWHPPVHADLDLAGPIPEPEPEPDPQPNPDALVEAIGVKVDALLKERDEALADDLSVLHRDAQTIGEELLSHRDMLTEIVRVLGELQPQKRVFPNYRIGEGRFSTVARPEWPKD